MISYILISQDYIPPYGIWKLFCLVLTSLVSLWCGYRWGLRSQKEAEKLKARIEALSVIDSILTEIPKLRELVLLFINTRDDLKNAVIRLSCQFGERQRLRIEKTLNDYQTLNISYSWPPTEGQPNMQIIKKEHKLMLDALQSLRNLISNS